MASLNISARQVELLKGVCEVMKADIEWDKVAKIANFSSGKYARDQWAVLRTKLIGDRKGDGNATEGGDDGEKKTKKAATPRKRKNGDGADGENPSKKKATPRKGKKDAQTAEDGEANDEENGVKPEPEADEDDYTIS